MRISDWSSDVCSSDLTIAVPGAIAQIAVASGLGIALGLSLGWSFAGSAIFGLALSVASTVVLLRALQARDMVETDKGRIAVGWLIVEDLAMVFALVRSEEHTSELQSLMRISYAVFCLKKKQR